VIDGHIENKKTKKPHLSAAQMPELSNMFQDGCDFLEQGDYEETIRCFKEP